jgi:hypothetical protein
MGENVKDAFLQPEQNIEVRTYVVCFLDFAHFLPGRGEG